MTGTTLPRHAAVLFDCFGTLVDFERDVTAIEYPATHALVTSWGWPTDYDTFAETWPAALQALDKRSTVTHAEFSMTEVAAEVARRCDADLPPERNDELVATFMSEWRRRIRPVDGLAEMVGRLAPTFRLGVVSNTHEPAMVPELLDQLAIDRHFDLVLLSIDHGHRKPHPSIYTTALEAFGFAAERVAFVGDDLACDFTGPTAAGMDAYLIDPDRRHDVPPDRRLDRLTDLEAILSGDRLRS